MFTVGEEVPKFFKEGVQIDVLRKGKEYFANHMAPKFFLLTLCDLTVYLGFSEDIVKATVDLAVLYLQAKFSSGRSIDCTH
jgi:hypothetical protein